MDDDTTFCMALRCVCSSFLFLFLVLVFLLLYRSYWCGWRGRGKGRGNVRTTTRIVVLFLASTKRTYDIITDNQTTYYYYHYLLLPITTIIHISFPLFFLFISHYICHFRASSASMYRWFSGQAFFTMTAHFSRLT
ncbi:hypothetical protein B0H63DRAFT_313370 [Podospora didyma]|uniref:Uncharacterized protein n=1 Tax=Podospora didyma TaxID=330526 RepID=A0AAE0K605_9PEZI|nr:hypothetical protein B0H63DRAFT_313370 [Podospora didyma]